MHYLIHNMLRNTLYRNVLLGSTYYSRNHFGYINGYIGYIGKGSSVLSTLP